MILISRLDQFINSAELALPEVARVVETLRHFWRLLETLGDSWNQTFGLGFPTLSLDFPTLCGVLAFLPNMSTFI